MSDPTRQIVGEPEIIFSDDYSEVVFVLPTRSGAEITYSMPLSIMAMTFLKMGSALNTGQIQRRAITGSAPVGSYPLHQYSVHANPLTRTVIVGLHAGASGAIACDMTAAEAEELGQVLQDEARKAAEGGSSH